MLSKTHRFHGHNTVRAAYRQGSVVRTGLGSLHSHVNPKRRSYRVAVVVSKKVDKSAVKRNRIRRRVYEVVRLHADRITKPYDLVFTIFDTAAAEAPAGKLADAVISLLDQARVS